MKNNYLAPQSSMLMQDLSSILPKGYENIFLVIYAILVPYVLGLLFFLFTIGVGVFHIFSNIPYIVIWLVGYEVFSLLVLLYILKKTIFFTAR
ncbi:MAG: hypothetical protein JW682_04725 [Campylobacterales bacterium]|nr:hypothetical protein [Campylobacterales bacterium]HEO99383.1 hypothetical protein [Campylobacterota bacterium]